MSNASQLTLTGKRVLVTGASGFLGRHLCAHLSRLGAEVHGTSRVPRPEAPGIRWWHSEITTVGDVEALFEAIDPALVYHLSGEVDTAPHLEMLERTYRSLLTSTICLLSVSARNRKPRLILAGSLEEVDSRDPELVPPSPYSAAKTAASQYARLCHQMYGAPVVVLRTFMGYGPEQSEKKLVPATLRAILAGQIPKLSSGQRELDWIHVDDIVDAYAAAGLSSDAEGRVLDIGTGRLTSIRTLVKLLVACSGKQAELQFGALEDRVNREPRVADLGPPKAILGWAPKIPLETGLQQTVNWYLRRWTSSASAERGDIDA